MKNIGILLLIFLLSQNCYGQKVEYNKETEVVSIDGVSSFYIKKHGCGFGWVECYFDVFSMDSTLLFSISLESFNNPANASKSNPSGTVKYSEFTFYTDSMKCESSVCYYKSKGWAEYIVSSNFIKDKKLNSLIVKQFVFRNGTKFSDEKKGIIR